VRSYGPKYEPSLIPMRRAPLAVERSLSVVGTQSGLLTRPVPGEFRICRHHPRDQDELSQSFDFLIFKRGSRPGTSPKRVLRSSCQQSMAEAPDCATVAMVHERKLTEPCEGTP
jgi:hypothetical protein